MGHLVQVQTTAYQDPYVLGILNEYNPGSWWNPSSGHIVVQGLNKTDVEHRDTHIVDDRKRLIKDVTGKNLKDVQIHRISLDKVIDTTLLEEIDLMPFSQH
ncbi:MAG: hypothetical protein MAG795_00895 [Candidatus Woesearchaeota archaeon]|nr:hypothetical protein [Candidatus Woesearchaeota archaeon]